MSAAVDARSIGELLLDADLQARRLLLNVQGQDGLPMLATFDEVVQSAARLWGALPASPGSDPGRASMRQLAALSESMHQSQITRDWPPAPTTRDARLGDIADTFELATGLARSRAGRATGTTEQGQADLAAARARIMHVVYVGSHAVALAVREHVHDVHLLPQKRISMRETRGVPRGQEAVARLGTFEQIAGNVIGNRFGDTVARQYQPERPGEERLRFALIDWDIRAHKVLGESPSLASLHLIAQTQAGIAVGSRVITRAAHEYDELDGDTYRARIEPALQGTDTAWSGLASAVGQLLPRAEPPRADLAAAAAEVRAALLEITHDGTTWASPVMIGARVDLGAAGEVVSHAIAASADVAIGTRHAIDDGTGLQVTTRGIAAYAATLPAQQRTGTGQQLSARDLQVNPLVRIPEAIHASLTQHAEQVARTSQLAAGATGHIVRDSLSQELLGARTALSIAERNVREAREHVDQLLEKLHLPPETAAQNVPGQPPQDAITASTANVPEQLARIRATRAAAARASFEAGGSAVAEALERLQKNNPATRSSPVRRDPAPRPEPRSPRP